MLFSIYPVDPPAVQAAVVAQARSGSDRPLVFTSLHLPESQGLRQWGEQLADWHARHGLSFCADLSPRTLDELGIGLGDIGLLRDWGVTVARIDFGFEAADIRRIAAAGLQLAVNASTADAALLDALADVRPVGWHNYYPRPETGISVEFFQRQNDLFSARGLELYSFIPGEVSFRAPLGLGLPTLEGQRHLNAYLNYVQLKALCPSTQVVCAEGIILDQHADWIKLLERNDRLTLPLTNPDESVAGLFARGWRIRVEQTDYSWRLEDTRSQLVPARRLNAASRHRGSLQMDLPALGRYQGEIHIMRRDLPLTFAQARVAEISRPYESLTDHIRPGHEVVFA
ncbi:MAG: MupG family TIM beta-alpha barrel fold protein [Propionibacteriaceae bacterium]|jgi:hypothetical protein|nr:MupG family TIM beta-alpha barrel fold protein [Propionibacteriaceae bacterium]